MPWPLPIRNTAGRTGDGGGFGAPGHGRSPLLRALDVYHQPEGAEPPAEDPWPWAPPQRWSRQWFHSRRRCYFALDADLTALWHALGRPRLRPPRLAPVEEGALFTLHNSGGVLLGWGRVTRVLE